MKRIGLNPPASSLLNDDLATLPPKPMGLNPPLFPPNGPPAPFSDPQPPSFSSNSSLSSFLISSPFHGLLPSSAVPFSWERLPGIPKLPAPASSASEPHLLPLPPPLRSAFAVSRNNKRSGAGQFDPFAVALAECAKDGSPESGEDVEEGFWWRRVGMWRRATIADRIGLVSFYGSCKRTCAVSDATVVVPRPDGRMNRRRQ